MADEIEFGSVLAIASPNEDDDRGNYGYGLKAHDTNNPNNLWDKILKANQTIYLLEQHLLLLLHTTTSSGNNEMVMILRFGEENGALFLPREMADSLPFTTTMLPQILKQFSLEPQSEEAKGIEYTIWVCEQPAFRGESKYCATSLESMIDFALSHLPTTHLKVLGTEVESKRSERKSYRIEEVKKVGEDSVVCHKTYYGYAVYYCHKLQATRSYQVSLQEENNNDNNNNASKLGLVKALVVCHTDTSGWDPHFPAFKILNVKPGTLPICHFLGRDNLVWVAN